MASVTNAGAAGAASGAGAASKNGRTTSTYRGGAACPSCKSTATASRGECLDCGAVWGDEFLCPFCEKHTRPVADPLLKAACPSCHEPRIDPRFAKEAYDTLLGKRRTYRRWHARALVYVPLACAPLAIFASGFALYLRASAKLAHQSEIAERMVDLQGPRLGDSVPEPQIVFVLSLLVLGTLGLLTYLTVALALRASVAREASRLVSTVEGRAGNGSG